METKNREGSHLNCALQISPEQKGIFIHIPRTAGTTVYKHTRSVAPRMITSHATAFWLRQTLGENFDKLFKFAFVRNPWERHVSWYLFCKRECRMDSMVTFTDYVEKNLTLAVTCASIDWLLNGYWSQSIFVTHNGEVIVDFIGQYENFYDDFSFVCSVLGLDRNFGRLNETPQKYDYREFYTDNTASLIEERCQWEIKKFGYKFEQAKTVKEAV